VGSRAFQLVNTHIPHPGECLLEVGFDRGEESTGHIAWWAATHRVPFYCIEADVEALTERNMPAGTSVILGRAEDVLAEWAREPIGFAWVDGADWPYSWFIDGSNEDYLRRMEVLRSVYHRWGATPTKEQSLRSHLRIARELNRLAALGADVVFDDTWLSPNGYTGKGGYAVPYLLRRGWVLVHVVQGDEPSDGYAHLRLR
jgi:hypothetical protein